MSLERRHNPAVPRRSDVRPATLRRKVGVDWRASAARSTRFAARDRFWRRTPTVAAGAEAKVTQRSHEEALVEGGPRQAQAICAPGRQREFFEVRAAQREAALVDEIQHRRSLGLANRLGHPSDPLQPAFVDPDRVGKPGNRSRAVGRGKAQTMDAVTRHEVRGRGDTTRLAERANNARCGRAEQVVFEMHVARY